MEADEIRMEVMTIPNQAKMIMVIDQESLSQANIFFLNIKGIRKKIEEIFGPIISKAFAAHKEAVAQRKKVEEPLILAESYLNNQIAIYHREQEEIRKKELEHLWQIAIQEEIERRRVVEKQKLEKAAKLEELGAREESDQLMYEAIQENEAPVIVNVPPPPTPRVEMAGMAMVTSWKFRITKESLIPRQYLSVNEQVIGAIVRRLKDKTNIPGIQAYSENKARATGR